MEFLGKNVMIRPFNDKDAEDLVKLLQRNKLFWSDTEPKRTNSYYTIEVQRQQILHNTRAIRKGTRFTFGIFLVPTNQLIGEISLYDVLTLPFQSANIGYSIDQEESKKGYGTESLHLVLDFAFRKLMLHRVQAGVMPRNRGSIRLLEKAGFQREGFARENICINDVWESHFQYALLAKEWKEKI